MSDFRDEMKFRSFMAGGIELNDILSSRTTTPTDYYIVDNGTLGGLGIELRPCEIVNPDITEQELEDYAKKVTQQVRDIGFSVELEQYSCWAWRLHIDSEESYAYI